MIVNRWTSTEVRALRMAALRETQEQFAERAGYLMPSIKKWHRATPEKPVRGPAAECLDTMLRNLTDEQRARFAAELAAPRADGEEGTAVRSSDRFGLYMWEVDNEVKRREFGKLAAAAGAVAMAGLQFGERIGMPDVGRVLASVDRLVMRDQVAGAGTLVRFAVEELAHAKHALDTGTYTGVTGDALASAVGYLAVETGWLAFDSGMQPLARRCYTDALALATEAGDDDLIACACLHSAHQSITLARSEAASPHHALKLIGRARGVLRGKPGGRMYALIAAREAQAYGLLGDRAGFGRSISAAYREVDHAAEYEPVEECPQWLRFVTDSEVRGHEARGWHDAGESSRAFAVFDAAMSDRDSRRNSVNLRAWAAATYAAVGDTCTALEIGAPVLDQLETIVSPRTLLVLNPVRAVAETGAGENFRQRFDALAARMQQKAITA